MRRRHDFFRVSKVRRVYDREQGKFSFNISYSTAVALTPRTKAVAEAFGLGIDEEHRFPVLDVELKIGPKDIVYVTGDSGSGKSVLLRAIKQDLGDEAIDVADVQVDQDKPLIETIGRTVEEGLETLAKVGLGDAFLFLRTYNQLSDGQKYRYKIAKLMQFKAQYWILDEFAATLDRDTAKIVAFNLQKYARQQGKAVLAATTHTDLSSDLKPTVHIHKRFGKEITVEYHPHEIAYECSLIKEMHVEQGTMADWNKLAVFHYRSHRIPAPRRIFCLKRGNEVCGVIVYSYPAPTCFGRRIILPKMSMKELNEKVGNISRVVVHPKYRTMGLGTKLIKETLPLAGTDYVEMSAVMARYNPFAEKAGMKKVAEQHPPKEAVSVVEVLKDTGFNIELISSTKYVLSKLHSLAKRDIEKIRQVFIRSRHIRFMKSFSYHLPFGKKEDYEMMIAKANLEKLAQLINICSFLMQKKVYLLARAMQSCEKNPTRSKN